MKDARRINTDASVRPDVEHDRALVPPWMIDQSTEDEGANIWKIHATATYVAWCYPFVLIGTLDLKTLVWCSPAKTGSHAESEST